jgi:hypothetical protein
MNKTNSLPVVRTAPITNRKTSGRTEIGHGDPEKIEQTSTEFEYT